MPGPWRELGLGNTSACWCLTSWCRRLPTWVVKFLLRYCTGHWDDARPFSRARAKYANPSWAKWARETIRLLPPVQTSSPKEEIGPGQHCHYLTCGKESVQEATKTFQRQLYWWKIHQYLFSSISSIINTDIKNHIRIVLTPGTRTNIFVMTVITILGNES